MFGPSGQRLLSAAAGMAIGAGLLLVVPVGAWRSSYSASIPRPEPLPTAMRSIEDGLACKDKLTAFISASSVLNKAELFAGTTNESVSVRLDRSKREICLITATMVDVGNTDGCGLKIVRDDDHYVTATQNLLSFETVIFDKSNQTMVWTTSGTFFGLTAGSHYLECR